MSNIRFECAQNEQERDPIQLRYIAASRFENDWHSARHSHACAEIFYCVDGHGAFLIQGETLRVEAGNLILINANVAHTEQSAPDNPLEYIVLGISGLEFLLQSSSAYLVAKAGDLQRETILQYLHAMQREVSLRHPYFEEACHHLLELLIILIRRMTSAAVLAVGDGAKRMIHSQAAWAKHFMDEHYAENITLERLADLVMMNKFTLGHLFQKAFGISPIKYLTQRRIQEAKSLLENSDLTISQVAEELNFASLCYFSQRFRSFVGVSPSAFRKGHPSSTKPGAGGLSSRDRFKNAPHEGDFSRS